MRCLKILVPQRRTSHMCSNSCTLYRCLVRIRHMIDPHYVALCSRTRGLSNWLFWRPYSNPSLAPSISFPQYGTSATGTVEYSKFCWFSDCYRISPFYFLKFPHSYSAFSFPFFSYSKEIIFRFFRLGGYICCVERNNHFPQVGFDGLDHMPKKSHRFGREARN